ncbi:hypothetical protein AK812_SmicGene19372 [Symbiodinium microadriaticum]|uniref:Uncharacterized protein n=1 Tax=Symbiodinium microadriaticum TaxID=2951 RepID=A0A1Q9DSR4_SYMMI|nr:hypothetical protein AK812_SmicGene19372 [Symbiodinium microadriaticum]
MDEKTFDLFGLDGFEASSMAFLQESHDRCEITLQWIQRLIVESDAKQLLKIAPPILSRVFNELGNGIVNLNNARKITDFPIPFHLAQQAAYICCMDPWIKCAMDFTSSVPRMITVMLIVHSLILPLISAATVDNMSSAAGITFFEVPKHLDSILLGLRFSFEPQKHLLLKTKSINFDRNLSVGGPCRQRMSRFKEAQAVKKESRESDKRDKDECTEIPIQGDDGQQEQVLSGEASRPTDVLEGRENRNPYELEAVSNHGHSAASSLSGGGLGKGAVGQGTRETTAKARLGHLAFFIYRTISRKPTNELYYRTLAEETFHSQLNDEHKYTPGEPRTKPPTPTTRDKTNEDPGYYSRSLAIGTINQKYAYEPYYQAKKKKQTRKLKQGKQAEPQHKSAAPTPTKPQANRDKAPAPTGETAALPELLRHASSSHRKPWVDDQNPAEQHYDARHNQCRPCTATLGVTSTLRRRNQDDMTHFLLHTEAYYQFAEGQPSTEVNGDGDTESGHEVPPLETHTHSHNITDCLDTIQAVVPDRRKAYGGAGGNQETRQGAPPLETVS